MKLFKRLLTPNNDTPNPDTSVTSPADTQPSPEIPGDPPIEELIAALGDADAEERYIAAETLAALADPRAVDALAAALSDPDSGVRLMAAQALFAFGDERAVGSLCAALEDSSGVIRCTAARTLGRLADRRAVEPLIIVLGDQDELVRTFAAEALGTLGDPRAVEPLSIMLRIDPDSGVRLRAVQALEAICDEQAIPSLTEALSDPDIVVRGTAELALRKFSELSAPVPLPAKPLTSTQPVSLGVRFAIGSVDDSQCGYGEACWRLFWRAVDISLVAGAELLEGDTAASPDLENVYCLGFRWWVGEGQVEAICAALEQSEEYRRAAAPPMFLTTEQVSREPLIPAGQLDRSGRFVDTSYRAQPAWLVVSQEGQGRKMSAS